MGVRGAVVTVPVLSLLATVAMGAEQPAEYRTGLRQFVTEMSRMPLFRCIDLDGLRARTAYRQNVIGALATLASAYPPRAAFRWRIRIQ
jgi:hypothetical protein